MSRRSISLPALKYGTPCSSTWTVSWVRGFASEAGTALLHHEGAEPTQLDALAARQSGGDLVEYRRDDQFNILLPQMRAAGGEFRDEFCPGQRRLRVTADWRTAPPSHCSPRAAAAFHAVRAVQLLAAHMWPHYLLGECRRRPAAFWLR